MSENRAAYEKIYSAVRNSRKQSGGVGFFLDHKGSRLLYQFPREVRDEKTGAVSLVYPVGITDFFQDEKTGTKFKAELVITAIGE